MVERSTPPAISGCGRCATTSDGWYAWAMPEYAGDLVRNESLTPEDALAQATKEADALLPDGLATPGHRLRRGGRRRRLRLVVVGCGPRDLGSS